MAKGNNAQGKDKQRQYDDAVNGKERCDLLGQIAAALLFPRVIALKHRCLLDCGFAPGK